METLEILKFLLPAIRPIRESISRLTNPKRTDIENIICVIEASKKLDGVRDPILKDALRQELLSVVQTTSGRAQSVKLIELPRNLLPPPATSPRRTQPP